MGRFLRLVRRRHLDRELSRELAAHLDLIADDLIARGIPREEAYRRARIQLGGVAQVTEASREARGTRILEELLRDLRLTFRGLRRSPVFTIAAVLTLGLGVGANTAVWNVLDALLYRALPVPRSSELHVLRSSGSSDDDPNYLFSYLTMQRFQQRLPDSVRLAAMSSIARLYLARGAQPTPVETQMVSGNWFSVLEVGAIRGRPLNPSDDQEGAPSAIVLSERFWRRGFGGDPGIIGQTVRLNGVPLTIAGVIEEGFDGLTIGDPVDVWVPLHLQPTIRFSGNSHSTDSDTEKPWLPQQWISWLTITLRAPTGLPSRVQAALAPVHRASLTEEYAGADSTRQARVLERRLALEPLGKGFSTLRSSFRDPVKVLMVSVGLVFLICCANLASLLLAKSSAREQELAVRASLGAGSRRLFRQALTESLTLGILGGIISVPVAWGGAGALLRAASAGAAPIPLPVALDWRGLGFALLLSILAGILLGLGPALRATRIRPLVAGGSRSTTRALHRLPWGRLLVVSQIALSLALVTAAGLFVRTLRNILRIETGYEHEQVIEARVDARSAGYRYDELPGLHRRILDAISAVPGVTGVGLAMNGLAAGATRTSGFQVPGIARARDFDASGQENFVSPGWFSAVGLALLRGREFTGADRSDGPRVAVVSQAFAKHFFGTEDVVGRRFGYGDPAEMEVVGVVRDARVNALRQRPRRLVFYPLAQGPQEYIQSIEARVTGSPGVVARAVRAALAQSEPLLPVREVIPVGDLLKRQLSRETMMARLAGGFSVLALLLAALGLYGVLAYSVSRRTPEIGVRLALGASPSSVWRLILRECTSIVALGIVLGLALWIPVHRLLDRMVYGLSSFDPTTLSFAGIVLLVIALVAGSLPAWRAARVDPARTLRNQ